MQLEIPVNDIFGSLSNIEVVRGHLGTTFILLYPVADWTYDGGQKVGSIRINLTQPGSNRVSVTVMGENEKVLHAVIARSVRAAMAIYAEEGDLGWPQREASLEITNVCQRGECVDPKCPC